MDSEILTGIGSKREQDAVLVSVFQVVICVGRFVSFFAMKETVASMSFPEARCSLIYSYLR